MLAAVMLAAGAMTAAAGGAAGCGSPGGSLAGDVDRDGVRDRVTIAGARDRGGRCRLQLLVRSSRREYRTRVVPYGAKDEGERPAIVALVSIARDRSLQVVVNVHHGASTSFGDLYGVHRGALRRLPFDGGAGSGFSYAGSLASSSAIDCAAGRASGVVVRTLQGHIRDGRWSVSRETFRLQGGRLRRAGAQLRVLPARLDLPDRPFASCTVATAAR